MELLQVKVLLKDDNGNIVEGFVDASKFLTTNADGEFDTGAKDLSINGALILNQKTKGDNQIVLNLNNFPALKTTYEPCFPDYAGNLVADKPIEVGTDGPTVTDVPLNSWRVININNSVDVYYNVGNGIKSVNSPVISESDPSTEDIQEGTFKVWYNSTTDTLKTFANIGGVIKS